MFLCVCVFVWVLDKIKTVSNNYSEFNEKIFVLLEIVSLGVIHLKLLVETNKECCDRCGDFLSLGEIC